MYLTCFGVQTIISVYPFAKIVKLADLVFLNILGLPIIDSPIKFFYNLFWRNVLVFVLCKYV